MFSDESRNRKILLTPKFSVIFMKLRGLHPSCAKFHTQKLALFIKQVQCLTKYFDKFEAFNPKIPNRKIKCMINQGLVKAVLTSQWQKKP